MKNSAPRHDSSKAPPIPGWGEAGGYSGLTITKAPEWHEGIAFDALFNGMATGLFLVAAVCELTLPEVFTAVSKLAYPVALVLLLIDLVMLVIDLGDRSRFHHMLRVFKPRSPMSVGTWSLTIFSLPLTAAAAFSLLSMIGTDFEVARKVAVVLGLVPGFSSAAYKGVLLSTNSQPGWKDARWMGGYLTSAAILLGGSEMLLLAALTGQARSVPILRHACIALLVLNVIPLGLLLVNLRPTIALLLTREQQWRTGMLALMTAILIPLVLMLLGDSLVLVSAAVISLWLGSLVLRLVYIRLPHLASSKPGH